MRIRTLFTTLAIAALATVTINAQDEAFSLKPTVKKDDVFSYKVVGQFDVQGQTADFSAKFTQKVVGVEDGHYTIEQKQTDPHVQVGGQEYPMNDDAPAVTAKFKSTGELEELKATDDKYTGADAYRAAALETLLVPANPVKTGDSWSFKVDAAANKWKKTQVDYKVEGTEKVGNFDCVRVSFAGKELEGGDEAAAESGKIWLSKSDFSLVKRDAKVSNLPLPGSPVTLSGTIKFEREVPATPAATPLTPPAAGKPAPTPPPSRR